MTRAIRIAGVVLAAGAGERMGGPKAELRIDDERLLDRATRLLVSVGCARVVAVVRAGTSVGDARAVVNPDPARGMRSSLELGVAACSDLDAIAVVLVDTPGLLPSGVAAVLDAWRPGRIAVARYGAAQGHPTVMSPDHWRLALQLAGVDEGARALLRAEPELVDEVAVAGDPRDLDTREDLQEWTSTKAPGEMRTAVRTVAEEMLTNVKVSRPDTTIGAARALFGDDHVHCVVVVDHGVLLAVVDRGDILPAHPDNGLVADLGSLHGRVVEPSTDLPTARRLLAACGRRRLGVADVDGTFRGLLCLKRSGSGFCTDDDVRARDAEPER